MEICLSQHSLVAVMAVTVFMSLICASVFPRCSALSSMTDMGVLKYVVKDVFVGKVKHVIEIVNHASETVTDGELIVPLIKNATARHYAVLRNITAVGGTFEKITFLHDGYENMYACLKRVEIQPDCIFRVELDYSMLSVSVSYQVNSSLIGKYNEASEVYKWYTQPEELIESDDQTIINIAQNLTEGESSYYDKALRIYNFVTAYLNYQIQDEERGALWALENHAGDCSEYSYLFAALCRAAGIPARVQAGFAFHYIGEAIQDGHMWAEFYLENYGWIPVDATWRLFAAMDFLHLSSIQSTPEIIPYANFVFNSTMATQLEENQYVQLTSLSPSNFTDSYFAEQLTKSVQKLKRAESTFFTGKIFGVNILFPSEMHEIAQMILTAKISIQDAIDAWELNTKIAVSSVICAFENADEALNTAWLLTAETFAVYISIPAVLLLVSLFFLRRFHPKPSRADGISHIAESSKH